MTKTLHAVDGGVSHSEEPADPEADKHYLLSVEPVEETTEDWEIKNAPAPNVSAVDVKTDIQDMASEQDKNYYDAPNIGIIGCGGAGGNIVSRIDGTGITCAKLYAINTAVSDMRRLSKNVKKGLCAV